MAQNGIAVLAPIIEGQEDACRAVLEGLNTEAQGAVQINFSTRNLTHFARFVILPDYDRGKNCRRLLFTAVFDGSRNRFWHDMRDNTSDIDAIWRHCVGYQGKNVYPYYMEDHNNPTGTFLRGHSATVDEIQAHLQLREDLGKKFDVPLADYDKVLRQLPGKSSLMALLTGFNRRVSNFLRDLGKFISMLPRLIGLLRHGRNLIEARNVLYTNLQLPRTYSDAPFDRSGPCVPFGPGDEVVPCKENDALPVFLDRGMVQNQMTVVTVNDPKFLKRQEAILDLIDTLANIPFFTRESVIPTIHFGRWLMIDGGKRMLFLSNYDGAWQTYIGDFVDKASNGLNAFWCGSYGWRDATTLDIELFKEGIRCHQTRASYFYCAYPLATVLNVNRAKDLYEGYTNNVNSATAKNWLKWL